MPGPGGLGPMGARGFLTEEEKNNMPVFSWDLIRRILGYLKPYWVQFLFVFIAILLSAVVGLYPSIVTGKIVDALGSDSTTLRQLVFLLLLAFGTLTVSQLIGVLENYINAWISQRVIFDMKNQMFDHLQHMPHAFFTSEKQGDIITRMNTDISGVSTVISSTLSSIVSNIATVITTLVALFTMNWRLAIVGIIVIPLLVLPTKSVGKCGVQGRCRLHLRPRHSDSLLRYRDDEDSARQRVIWIHLRCKVNGTAKHFGSPIFHFSFLTFDVSHRARSRST